MFRRRHGWVYRQADRTRCADPRAVQHSEHSPSGRSELGRAAAETRACRNCDRRRNRDGRWSWKRGWNWGWNWGWKRNRHRHRAAIGPGPGVYTGRFRCACSRLGAGGRAGVRQAAGRRRESSRPHWLWSDCFRLHSFWPHCFRSDCLWTEF